MLTRNLSQKNLDTIHTNLINKKLTYLNNENFVDTQWETIKNNILFELDNTAPKKTINLSTKIRYPWNDKELKEIQKLRDIHCDLYHQTSDTDQFQLYHHHYKSTHQALKRLKMKNFFNNKNSKDFKNTKQYWKFYSTSIKIKSDKTKADSNITLKEDGQYFSDPAVVANKFNKFFTTLSSNSIVDIKESLNKIDEIYEEIKLTKTYSEMNFVEVSEKSVEKGISELDISSGAGISDIPTSIIKSCSCIIPALTNLFNECIKQQ